MPIFNHFYLVNNKLDPQALLNRGPVLNIEISVPTTLANLWDKQGLQIPAPQPGVALLDTGASRSCVDRKAIQKLGIPSIGIERVYTPQGNEEQQKYPVRVSFPGTPCRRSSSDRPMGLHCRNRDLLL